MKRILDIFRALFLSPELACIVVLAAGGYFLHDQITVIISTLKFDEDAFGWIAIIPVAPLALTLKERSSLLSPDSKLLSQYFEWPGYVMVKDRFYITLFWEITSTCSTVSIWLFGLKMTNLFILLLFLGGIVISLVSYCLFLNATIKLKQLMG